MIWIDEELPRKYFSDLEIQAAIDDYMKWANRIKFEWVDHTLPYVDPSDPGLTSSPAPLIADQGVSACPSQLASSQCTEQDSRASSDTPRTDQPK